MGSKRRRSRQNSWPLCSKLKTFARGREGISGLGLRPEVGASCPLASLLPAPQAAQKTRELLQRHSEEPLIVDTVSTESLSVSYWGWGVSQGLGRGVLPGR